MKKAKRFLMNSLILACSAVFMRAINVSFNVYITNKIGAEGVGLFGLIMSVYMLATTIASSGVNLAATRLITEELATGCHNGIKKAMHRCLCYSLFFGLSAGFLLFFFAPQIGTYWLCDSRTIRPLYLLSFSLPFIALSAAISGYFMAVRRIIKSASAQIFELLIKITITVFALRLFADRGIEYACIAIVGGGSIAEICSFFYIFLFYRFDRKRYANARNCAGAYTKRLLGIALPVAVSSYLRSGLVTLEHLLIPVGLKKFGASTSASLAQYGVVHGMVMPLLMFPSAVLLAFSGLLIPELTELQTIRKTYGINRIVSRAFRTTLLFSIGAATIFFVFAEPLGQVIYKSGDAGLFIKFLAPLAVVMYMDGVTDSMLKGLNQQVYSMRYNIIDSAISVALIYTLLPKLGIDGYLLVIFATELLNAFLSMNRLIKITDFSLSIIRDILRPTLAAGLSTAAVFWGANHLWGSFCATPFRLTGMICTTLIIYISLLALSKDF
ncbi:MAG: oligosaccharide flippase family protein [Clostridia bacterium]|nr:oligosaccharide flippase family protein [Clostridia bacterium]